MKTAYIYALMHPETKEVFYIGKTIDINIRMNDHKRMASYHFDEPGLKADYKIIDECDDRLSYFVEKTWIRHYLKNGANLCNSPRTHTPRNRNGIDLDFKEIELPMDIWMKLATMAIDNDSKTYKDFIHKQLILMAEAGKPYLDLYTEHQRTLQLLQELSKEDAV